VLSLAVNFFVRIAVTAKQARQAGFVPKGRDPLRGTACPPGALTLGRTL
jgi:hypothetical protein